MDGVVRFSPPFTISNKVDIEDEDGHICTAESPEIAVLIVQALIEKYTSVVVEMGDP